MPLINWLTSVVTRPVQRQRMVSTCHRSASCVPPPPPPTSSGDQEAIISCHLPGSSTFTVTRAAWHRQRRRIGPALPPLLPRAHKYVTASVKDIISTATDLSLYSSSNNFPSINVFTTYQPHQTSSKTQCKLELLGDGEGETVVMSLPSPVCLNLLRFYCLRRCHQFRR